MDIYAEITNRMISEMEQGIIPWKKPWMASGAAISHTTGKAYSLLNQMLLGRPGEWLTFKQCNEEGGFVRKGEKSRMVVFWKWIDKEDEETGEITQVPYLRYYNVFHIDQCEGITAKHMQANPNPANPDQTAEAMVFLPFWFLGLSLTDYYIQVGFLPSSCDYIVPKGLSNSRDLCFLIQKL